MENTENKQEKITQDEVLMALAKVRMDGDWCEEEDYKLVQSIVKDYFALMDAFGKDKILGLSLSRSDGDDGISELIEYAHHKHVLLTCPTTLIGVVFTLINITKDFNRNKHIKSLEKEIVAMYNDSQRMMTRLEGLSNTIEKLDKCYKEVFTSCNKIDSKIKKIHDGYMPEKESED